MNHKHKDYISPKLNMPKISDDICLAKCTQDFIKPKTSENQTIYWEKYIHTDLYLCNEVNWGNFLGITG